MLTYVATYRLRPAEGLDTGSPRSRPPMVSVRIADFCLHHAAARAEWRRPSVAASEGWHPGRTELVSVELAGEDQAGEALARARITALELAGCAEEAERLVAAAAIVAGVSQ